MTVAKVVERSYNRLISDKIVKKINIGNLFIEHSFLSLFELYFITYLPHTMLTNKQKHLVNFATLSNFTGNNPVFEKQLVTAFRNDLELFRMKVVSQPDEASLLLFRKNCHSIYPSLKMFEITELMEAIEAYKTAYNENEGEIAFMAERIHQLLDTVLSEVDEWLSI